MSQKAKRIANAFLLAFIAVLLLQVVNSSDQFLNALNSGDWDTLRALGLSAVAGAVVAALRALQSFIPQVPSPEPGENTLKS